MGERPATVGAPSVNAREETVSNDQVKFPFVSEHMKK
jgi:hypothetical protein